MSNANREPIEPPGGFEPRVRPPDPSSPGLRPDWLMGADDGGDFADQRERPTAPPSLARPGGLPRGGHSPGTPEPPAAGIPKFRLEPEAEEPEPDETGQDYESAEGWAPAASSVPKLSVAPRRDLPARSGPDDETDLEAEASLEDHGDHMDGQPSEATPEVVDAPREAWWLVAFETVLTHRGIQLGALAVVVVALAWTFWPRKENQSTAIAAIKQHPQRFEGQSVRVRGEVGEVFDVGSGVVFQLHQHRDTMVVFSPNRRPAPHDRLLIEGTVSTGYLDGSPRVALFEAPGAVSH